MVTLQSYRSYKDLVFYKNTGGVISQVGRGERTPEGGETKINGVFDIIKYNFLAIFSQGDNLLLSINCEVYLLDDMTIEHSSSGSRRRVSIKSGYRALFEMDYTNSDIEISDALLLGSYEEEEDYDFGAFLSKIASSEHRKSLLMLNWK